MPIHVSTEVTRVQKPIVNSIMMVKMQPCTTHIHSGIGTIVREVNSCACTLE